LRGFRSAIIRGTVKSRYLPLLRGGTILAGRLRGQLHGHVADGLLTILLGIFKLIPWMRLTM
jgi:hypothetical protein